MRILVVDVSEDRILRVSIYDVTIHPDFALL